MPSVCYNFSIIYVENQKAGPYDGGVYVRSSEDVQRYASISKQSVASDIRMSRVDIDLPEGGDELIQLLEALRVDYGFVPSRSRMISPEDRDKVFGLTKQRSYSSKELDESPFLSIISTESIIGFYSQGTDQQVKEEKYVVEKPRGSKRVPLIGSIAPFHAFAVSASLKEELERANLGGLVFESIIGDERIWKLCSSVVLPRCQTPLVDLNGNMVDPVVWPEKFGEKYFDDRGYFPFELSYVRDDFESMGPFDIAMTLERTGVGRARAFRWLVVSQRFRETLKRLKVRKVRYSPVRFT